MEPERTVSDISTEEDKEMEPRSMRRGALVLAVTILAAGAFAAAPALSAGKGLTKKRALKLFYTKAQSEARFLDQAEGDARFLNTDEKAADAERLDGLDSSAFARKMGNVVTVALAGGDFTSVQAAIDSITNASGSNPYLVLIGPGTYTGRVTLKTGVHLRGSGQSLTALSAPGATTCANAFTLQGVEFSEVSELTVINEGGADCAVAISNPGTADNTFYYRVSALAQNAAVVTRGVQNESAGGVSFTESLINAFATTGDAIGIEQSSGSTVLLSDSGVIASTSGDDGIGLYNQSSGGFIDDSSITGLAPGDSFGIFNEGAGFPVRIARSAVQGTDNSINTTGTGYTVRVAVSQLSGGPVLDAGAICAGVYNGSYVFSASTCP
jgi:hypothetical protein